MSLAALRESLASASGASTANEEGEAVGDDTTAKDPAPLPAEDVPFGVAQVVTPSGLEIYYQAGPKRLYRVKNLNDEDLAEWFEVPSVSTVLDVLEKGGLSWWGMKVGVEGIQSLVREGLDKFRINDETALEYLTESTVDQLVDDLKAAQLTVNHVKGKAADRGTNVHTALERYAETGVIPDPKFYPENERGYVAGLVAFLQDAHPNILESELMVASTDGWAGRFDTLANLDFAGDVVIKTYPKRQPKRAAVGGVWLLDLKTSKNVYASHKLQVGGAYRHGLEECGYGTADHAGVLRVTDDGRYELIESDATYEDFLSVLETYRVIQRLS